MTASTADDTTRFSAKTDFLGHPRGLAFLFTTEMWERFSYYGMRALLVLYMVKYLLHAGQFENVIGLAALKTALESIYGPLEMQPFSSLIYGLYTALVYSTPFMGGIIADRYLGQHRTIIIGAAMMAAGHFMMAFESLFLFALTMLILGNGCFKPNMSAQVGSLYAPGDPRRDRAYSIFYVGINLGAFLAPLVCGTLGEEVGWHYGFGAAGVGMIIGLVTYLAALHTRSLQPHELRRIDAAAAESKLAAKPDDRSQSGSILKLLFTSALSLLLVVPGMLIYIVVLISVLGFIAALGPYLSIPVVLLAVVGLYAILRRLPRDERVAIVALLVLFLPNTFFWATYEQQGNTIALWADDFTDRTIDLLVWHGEIPVTWFQAFNPFMIFAFTPFVVAFWARQAARGREPSTVTKMAIGSFGCGLSYVIMAVAAWQGGGDQVSWVWLFAYFVVITVGELYLSPIGLSLVSKVAPARMVSMMMGVWLGTSFIGNFMAGWLGSFWSSMDKVSFFLMIAGIAIFASVAIWIFNRPLRAVLKD